MKRKKPLTDITTETSVHISVQIPSLVDVKLDFSRKKQTSRQGFFKELKVIEPKLSNENVEANKLMTTPV